MPCQLTNDIHSMKEKGTTQRTGIENGRVAPDLSVGVCVCLLAVVVAENRGEREGDRRGNITALAVNTGWRSEVTFERVSQG